MGYIFIIYFFPPNTSESLMGYIFIVYFFPPKKTFRQKRTFFEPAKNHVNPGRADRSCPKGCSRFQVKYLKEHVRKAHVIHDVLLLRRELDVHWNGVSLFLKGAEQGIAIQEYPYITDLQWAQKLPIEIIKFWQRHRWRNSYTV